VGFIPNGPSSKLNGGVYWIKKVNAPDISNVVQMNTGTSPGAPDGANAVVFRFDSSDTGDLTIAYHGTTTLNGYEDAPPPAAPPVVPDAAGTHNFVLYGGPSNDSGATNGFQGNIAQLGPNDTPVYTGIIYMPNSTLVTKGNTQYQFMGAVYMKAYTLDGGGNGGQGFQFICGLGAISPRANDGALIR
jgi:hypothetical protein